jgi:hypothetical protein
MRRLSGIDGQARSEASRDAKKFSSHSFGAHFCEVAYDPGIARLRVTRWLTVIDDQSQDRAQSDTRLDRDGNRNGAV